MKIALRLSSIPLPHPQFNSFTPSTIGHRALYTFSLPQVAHTHGVMEYGRHTIPVKSLQPPPHITEHHCSHPCQCLYLVVCAGMVHHGPHVALLSPWADLPEWASVLLPFAVPPSISVYPLQPIAILPIEIGSPIPIFPISTMLLLLSIPSSANQHCAIRLPPPCFFADGLFFLITLVPTNSGIWEMEWGALFHEFCSTDTNIEDNFI